MAEIQTTKHLIQSVPKEDRAGKTNTIYDVSIFEVIWRNFIAGMSRAAGGIFLYLIFMFVIGSLFANLVWPQLSPMFEGYLKMVDSLGQISQTQQNISKSPLLFDQAPGVDLNSLQELFKK